MERNVGRIQIKMEQHIQKKESRSSYQLNVDRGVKENKHGEIPLKTKCLDKQNIHCRT